MADDEKKTREARLDDFVRANPGGWGHDQWHSLLGILETDGHDVSDPGAIGGELERMRLRMRLEELDVKGLGPKRTETVVGHFGRLWEVKQASAEELAGLPGFNGPVARALHRALR